jgi:hypothetical protein
MVFGGTALIAMAMHARGSGPASAPGTPSAPSTT